jgi:hypothetical protein
MANHVKLQPGWLARDILKASDRVKEWRIASEKTQRSSVTYLRAAPKNLSQDRTASAPKDKKG